MKTINCASLGAAAMLGTAIVILWPNPCETSPAAAEPAGQTVLYVATNGSDQWSGTLPEPTRNKTDGPLATLERARDAIRKMKQNDRLPEGGVSVVIRGGTYAVDKTLELTAEDSGTQAAPIVYRAQAGEEVRITGGKPVRGFRPITERAVLNRLDEPGRAKVLQTDLRAQGITDLGQVDANRLELFFQDMPMTLARWPNKGSIQIADLAGGSPKQIHGQKGDKIGKFIYEGDRPKRWVGEKDAWVHGYWFWDWSDQRHKIQSIDPQKRLLAVEPPYHHYGYRKGQWFYGLNILAELDSPGEWYLDRSSAVLYFWPPGPVKDGRPTVSILATLLSMRETSYVTVRGITFEAARGTAVTIRGGAHCKVVDCTLRNLGNAAVSISGGKSNGVENCHIHQTGAGGVSLSGGDRKTLTPAGHYALGNHIHDWGRWRRMYSAAVHVNGVGNRVARNLLHTAPHIAILFGGNDHLFELNEIHHVCREANDAGAIYAGRDWTMRGTIIRHNFMHHVSGFKNRGCVGVYLDDMFCGTTIFGNVFYKVTRAAFIGGGRDNVVKNNIFVDCNPALHVDARAMGWAASCVKDTMIPRLRAMPYQEPPWAEQYPKLVNILDGDPAQPTGNLVAMNVSCGGRWDGVHAKARPLVAFKNNLWDFDPGFVDKENMNFQLRDESPVYKRIPGFKKIPFEQIGLDRPN